MALNKLGTGAAALGMMAAASAPTFAESADKDPNAAIQLASYTVEQVDCVTHVKNQRSIRKQAGDPMSRKEMKVMLGECRNANIDARIDAQEDYIRDLDHKLASLDLQIDQNAQILDEQGRVIGRFISVQGQLEIQRATLEELEAENARINADIDATERSISAKKADIARLKADTARRNANADRNNARAAQLDTNTARLNADTNRLNADTNRLNADTQAKLDQAEAILRALAA